MILDLVVSVRHDTIAPGSLEAAKTAVANFKDAVPQYLQYCNARGIPETNMPENLRPETATNLSVLKSMIGEIVNSIGKQKGDSEMALMVDIAGGVYTAGPRIIVESKLDMCARCETGLDLQFQLFRLFAVHDKFFEFW